MFSKLKKLLKSGHGPADQEKAETGDVRSDPADGKRPGGKPETNVPPVTKGGIQETKKTGLRKNKQGIPVFNKDQDFSELFDLTEAPSPPPFPKNSPSKRKPSKKPSAKKRVNKHGFPILDDEDDLASLMGYSHDRVKPPDKNATTFRKMDAPQAARKTKHGIPILPDGGGDSLPFSDREESFEDLLKNSLGNKNLEVLMNQKTEGAVKRKPLTLKQKLKAYPLPQGQLDLHGYTALKAELRCEPYLKNAYHSKTLTVRIIVGKGLHSEEGAVLPDVVEKLLIRMKKEGIVLHYDWDNKRKSRSGAVTVYLDNMEF